MRAVEVIGNRIFASDEVGVFEREDVMSSSPPPSSPYPTNVAMESRVATCVGTLGVRLRYNIHLRKTPRIANPVLLLPSEKAAKSTPASRVVLPVSLK